MPLSVLTANQITVHIKKGRQWRFVGYIHERNMGSALITPYDAKDRGNEAFKKGQFVAASWWYSRGIQKQELHPENMNESQIQFLSTLYSNRSATFLEMGYLDTSLSDAYDAMMINPTWEKPYYRAAMCQMELDLLDDASTSLSHAHALSPNDKSILLARQKLFDAYRKKQLNGSSPSNTQSPYLPSNKKTPTTGTTNNQSSSIHSATSKRKRSGHSALLTWGRGEFGCLGHSDSKDQVCSGAIQPRVCNCSNIARFFLSYIPPPM